MSTGGAGMTACASAGGGTGSSATPAVSAGAGVSGGVERSMTASNISATPAGSAIHPPLRNAATIGSTNCWTREGGSGGDGCNGAVPCHSHKPDSWFSSCDDVMSDDTIACPPQDPKCGGDRQTDEMRSVSQTSRKPRLSRQSYPKPTYSDVAGQVVFIDPRGQLRLGLPGGPAPLSRGGVAYPPPWRSALTPPSGVD
jgi:hypothetical protein